ncbi:hypothetical protein [Proteus mirabilis]|uniref:hypothetical protein n=1 Tax=Proteus mirabilis TaxID=584 RepID=UPI001E356B91|nr:hypothetical protein [Proteus mirabilis]MCL8549437.1 hypothetical protein [Proteus mirabilis]MCL8564052.1 hypothetical protein [Proteus mirabilis]MCL8578472.1 hypothetical protein [Proteus mirabilis]MCS4549629.1 hypothetical protein [Proteus mirabilis]MCW9741520.1 hypothetical protein [Proteus mirabilis]
MKIFNILFFSLLIISNSSIGDEYPIITDKMLSSGYNKLELQYDPPLPLITPYPENKELVYPLIEKAKKITILMIAILLLPFSLLVVLI